MLARMWAARRAASALQDHAAGPRNGGAEARIDRVCELNVHSQVRTVRDSPIVRSAWERKQELAVHGWIYRLTDGRLRDLKCSCTEP